MKTKVEGDISLKLINQSAMNERAKKEHSGNMHLWWNRSPIDASKELINATINMELYEEPETSNVTIVDPFSGFGGLALAAVDSDLPVMAGDLNSVAVVLTKAAVEIPARFANQSAVSPFADNRIYTGTFGLAEDIRCYGQQIRRELEKRLNKIYPESFEENDDGEKVYAWIWSRTVPCPNPACGCKMPLANSYILSKLKDREYYVKPIIAGKQVSFKVMKGISLDAQQGNKIGKSGAKFKCPLCGEITTDEYVKEMGRNGNLGIQLMAVGYESKTGREFFSPSEDHIEASNVSLSSDSPLGDIPNNTRWFSPPLFGMKSYADLYSSRQLLLMSSLCELVKVIRDQIYEDAKKAGIPDDGVHLKDGGTGAKAYSEAVSVYLTLFVDKISNFQSEICTWDNRNGNIRAAFTRQAIPMTWVFAEGNPFSSVTGNFDTMLKDVVQSVKYLPCKNAAVVKQGDGTVFEFPENSILFTELPYYDNVGYADLSDYFYIWMRQCLKDVYPEIFEKVVTSKEELTSIPEHYGKDGKAAKEAYEEGIRRLCKHFSEAASREYPSVIFYEFSHADENAMCDDNNENYQLSAWETMIDALIRSDFHITAVFPVRTERPNERYETVRVCIVFRKRLDNAQITRRGFVSELKRTLPTLLEERFRSDIDIWDRPIVGMGVGLTQFSYYRKIINADGTEMNVHDALQVIWTEVNEYTNNLLVVENGVKSKEDSHAGEL